MKLNPYPEYKPSGVEWLGNVPQDWGVRRLKYMATANDSVLSESTPPDWELRYVDIGSVDYVNGITKKEEMVFENAPSRARRRVQDGDTIVSTVRTYLRAIAPIREPEDNLVVSTGFAVIRPREVDSGFLANYMRSSVFVETVVSGCVGVSYPATNASDVMTIPVPLPDEDEQQAIADFLDWETEKIDQLVAKKRELIAKLKEKRAALITHVVTRGLNPDAKLKPSGIEWLGDIPEHWDVPPLYARYTVDLGKMLDARKITGRCLVRYLRNVDVQWGRINYDDLPEMDISPAEIDRYTVQNGDLLVCEGGEVGRSAIIHGLGNVTGYQKALHRLRPRNQGEDVRYMLYTMHSACSMGIFTVGGTATIAHLTGEQLRKCRFPRPPLPEQQAIANYLDRETAKLDNLSAKVEEVITRLQEYRTALITAAVTGKIDVSTALNTGVRESDTPEPLVYPEPESELRMVAEKHPKGYDGDEII